MSLRVWDLVPNSSFYKIYKRITYATGDSDQFNIVVFYATVKPSEKNLCRRVWTIYKKPPVSWIPLPQEILKITWVHDILGAMRFALNINPNIVVLVTDIQPTRGEVDEVKIAEEIKRINTNKTRIYGVGVEVWEPNLMGV